MTTEIATRPMTEAEFASEVARIGYVEAVIAAAKRDGYPVNQVALRGQAVAGLAALEARGMRLTNARSTSVAEERPKPPAAGSIPATEHHR